MNRSMYHGCSGVRPPFANQTSSGGGMTNPMTAKGDVIRGDTGGTPVRLPVGSSGDVLTVIGGVPAWKVNAGISVSSQGVLLGANVYNCNQVAGFTNRFNAIKVSALGTGPVSKLSCYVFNTYGAQKLNIGLYDYAGNLLRSTGVQILGAGQNKTFTFSFPPIDIVSGAQYWIGVWGDGVDLPSFNSFAPYGSVFPAGMHAIENTSVTSLPLTISSAFPFAVTDNTFPINCFN